MDHPLVHRMAACQLLFLVLLMSTGCQTIAAFDVSEETTPLPDHVPVQIRPSGQQAKNIDVPVKDGMLLQDVVDAAKPRFRNKIVYIVRVSPKTGNRHKLEAKFGSNRRISFETDYAIQPGDRVVIAQDTTSSFDRVMKAVLGRT